VHEFSIASEIWSSVRAAAQQHGGGRVLKVKLEIGVLTLLAEDQLRFWIESLAERDGSPGVVVEISAPPGRVRCQECGAEADVPQPADDLNHLLPPPVRCPTCDSPSVAIVGGREIRVVSAEIDRSSSGPPT
jgi:hydrogenase nickel incorporation protein HypA/HybF